MSRRPLSAVLMSLLLCATLAVCATRPARAEMPSDAEMDSLVVMAQDTLRAPQGEAALRRVLLEAPPEVRSLVRHLVTWSLFRQRVSTPALLACADTMLADSLLKPYMRSNYTSMITTELLDRGERLGWADSAARAAFAVARTDPAGAEAAGIATTLIARIHLEQDRPDSAVAWLEPLAAKGQTTREVDWYLARGYDRTGRLDEAIRRYLAYHARGWADTTISERLRTAYAKRHGGLDGLDTLVAGARVRERRHQTFELPRVDGPAPAWRLRTLDGRRRSSRELAGRVTVLEFWGTWCGACVEGMPRFIELMRNPRWKDVAFQTVDCEFPAEGVNPRKRVASFVRERKWAIPVVQDSAMTTANAYGVEAFPTTVLIDHTGRMRFRNVGADPGGVLLRDQLALLLKEQQAGRGE